MDPFKNIKYEYFSQKKNIYSLLKRNASHIFDSAILLLGIYLGRNTNRRIYPYVTKVSIHTNTLTNPYM